MEKILGVQVKYEAGCDCGECYSSGSVTIVLPEKPTVVQRVVAEAIKAVKSRDRAYDSVEIISRPITQ